MNFSTPISELSRVGKKTAALLKKIGLTKAQDLLWYFPFRYEDYSLIVPIADLKEGSAVTIKARLDLIGTKRSFRRRAAVTEALVSDITGALRVVWFNQPFLTKNLEVGEELFLSGTVKRDMLGLTIISPAYEKFRVGVTTTNTARLVPVYPLTERLTQKQLRILIQAVLPLTSGVPDWLPAPVRESEKLLPLPAALRGIHFPNTQAELDASTRRLKFDELFLLQLQAECARIEQGERRAPQLVFQESAIKQLVQTLPFTLTPAQKKSAWEILQDSGKSQPMNRLLSGDVGSGKTVVAVLAMYNAACNGWQAVLMAPTEILALQHYQSICKLLGSADNVALLTSSMQIVSGETPASVSKAAQKRELKERIAAGTIQMVVGTQALLSEGVDFKRLGLVVVDEQHRFGVAQRQLIKTKGETVHFLSMTATPIPRSLALLLYGDLDISVIPELPPGRKKIMTRLVEPAKRSAAYDFIRSEVKAGRQVFVICPAIEPRSDESAPVAVRTVSPVVEKKSVLDEYEKLSKRIFPDLQVGYIHGKLKSVEKEKIMMDFKNKKIDILVSTSVVEVGVDIPNASVMMIEGAENFGLAQLHQFRGRVGRSSYQSYCLLFTEVPSTKITQRLAFFAATDNGFKLAEKDLELRGPGEVYGTAQSGLRELRLATLRDTELIKAARLSSKKIAPELSKYPYLIEKLSEWGKAVHLE